MKLKGNTSRLLVLVLILVVAGGLGSLPIAAASPSPTEEDIDRIATWLNDNQDQNPFSLAFGSWPPNGDHTGAIVIGLV